MGVREIGASGWIYVKYMSQTQQNTHTGEVCHIIVYPLPGREEIAYPSDACTPLSTYQEPVRVSVVASIELDDGLSAGVGAGKAEHAHARLGACIIVFVC